MTATVSAEMPEIVLSALIVADLHIVGTDMDEHARESFVLPHATSGRLRQPDIQLLEHVRDQGISADLLVCLGDLTNRAGMDGYKHGWDFLEKLAEAANCAKIVFTPGNHDVDSLGRYGADHRTLLKARNSPDRFRLPVATTHRIENELFEIYVLDGGIVVVNLDSNGSDPQVNTGKFGVVSIDTIDEVIRAVESLEETFSYGLLICHHHPYRHGDIDMGDYSAIDTAPELINGLGRTGVTDWAVLHGHKHMPRLALHNDYVIFAAGSMSASLHGVQACVSANQFHLLEIVNDPKLPSAHPYVGRIRSWDWAVLAWTPAVERGIPDHSGFGYVENLSTLAAKIAEFVDSVGTQTCDVSEIIQQFPGLPYLLPSHEKQLRHTLKYQHSINVLTEKSTAGWLHVGKALI